jgi:sugar O-acyltransferase (sialic acid O-acetyltransferase NeuD family)
MEAILQNKKRLFIVGAGGFGRELESWLELIPKQERDWHIVGYLDSKQGKRRIQSYPSDYEIIGEEHSFPLTKDDLVVIAISEPSTKEKIYKYLKDKVTFLTYIAPNTVVGKFNNIGEGSIICPNTIITTNIVLGVCVTLNIGIHIGHDVTVGDFSSLMPSVDIGGNCTLGKRVYMGTNSTIVPGKKIADDVKISSGSIVTRSIKEKSTVYGNPAQKLIF